MRDGAEIFNLCANCAGNFQLMRDKISLYARQHELESLLFRVEIFNLCANLH